MNTSHQPVRTVRSSSFTTTTVKIWDAASGQCVQTLDGHGGPVNSVVFEEEGTWLASGSEDTTVKLWDTTIGRCMQTLEGHGGPVNSVAYAADCTRLASTSDDKTVKIWDATMGQCIQTLRGHGGPVISVAFTADCTRLASGSGDSTVKVWDLATGACTHTLDVGAPIFHLSFDSQTNANLLTEVGTLILKPSASDAEPPSDRPTLPDCRHSGVSHDRVWIVNDARRLLWLPSEFRPSVTVIAGSSIALGSSADV